MLKRLAIGESVPKQRIFAILYIFIAVWWILLFDLNFQSDGERYYAYIRSMFFDFDLNFYNEYTFYTFCYSEAKGNYLETLESGYLWNPFAIGSPILWFPFFLIGHLWAVVLQIFGYPILTNGYSLPYLLATSLGTLLYGIVGLFCCVLFVSRFYSWSLALWVSLLTFFCSPAIAYLYREPAYSHTMGFCIMSLFLLLWTKFTYNGKVCPSVRHTMILGILGGLIFLVRWQEGVILLFPAIHIVVSIFSSNNKSTFSSKVLQLLKLSKKLM